MNIINDSIHGAIEIDEYCMQVIDTPQFQRLRDLKQLGSAYFVYPGAAHNRFEHSIGVAYLAGLTVEHLQSIQPELNLTNNDIKCVKLAGLCHDLGHGPFSHLFDNIFMQRAQPDLNWTHEQASEAMLKHLIDTNSHVTINAEELQFIQDLIHGKPRSDYPQAQKRFLFDIVANKRNSVDVDKFDYILRDCHNVGLRNGVDVRRFISFYRVIDNEICFAENVAFNLYEMFHTRYVLFRQVYAHRVVRTIDLMLADALLAADQYLGISSSVLDMSKFQHTTDSIIRQIERSQCDELASSRQILRRLRQRDLYVLVDQVNVAEDAIDIWKQKITPETVCQFADPAGHLQTQDMMITWHELGYSMSSDNPVDAVKFFDRSNLHVAFHIQRDQLSSFLPTTFAERYIAIFARHRDKSKIIKDAFGQLCANT